MKILRFIEVSGSVGSVGYNYYNKEGFDWYISMGYEYKGKIVPTSKEIEDVELQENSKKYNL